MANFEKYNLSQVKTERFYQLPKYLFEDTYFKKMSAELYLKTLTLNLSIDKYSA